MPAWAKANPTTRTTADRRGVVAALTLFAALLVVGPALARIDNSKNRDNPTNVANPWTEDLAREVGIVEKVNSPIPMLKFPRSIHEPGDMSGEYSMPTSRPGTTAAVTANPAGVLLAVRMRPFSCEGSKSSVGIPYQVAGKGVTS